MDVRHVVIGEDREVLRMVRVKVWNAPPTMLHVGVDDLLSTKMTVHHLLIV